MVFKPEGIKGYDITAKEWWGGEQNIPYGWIRPSDYISDYFIRVVAVKGNWSNYHVLSNDPIWHKYFDKTGIIKDKIGAFCSAEGITFIGSWTGTIIPHFVDKQGNYLYIEDKVNAVTERTGLLMSINEDALQVISYDKNGVDIEVGCQQGKGSWVYDFDENAQAESELGEGEIEDSGYLVDMIGHNLQNGIYKNDLYIDLKEPTNGDGDGADASYPTAYFLKTKGGYTDSSIIPLLLNNRETSNEDDDIQAIAKIRVLTNKTKLADAGSSITDFYKAYVVIDSATNTPIKGDGNATGVKTWYVISNEFDASNGIVYTSKEHDSSVSTSTIKSMTVYGQKNKNISYNISDSSFIYNGSYITNVKKVADILSPAEKATGKELKLREIPVVKDTNDNFVYMDASVYYGAYAYIIPETNPDVNSDTVRLFSVTGGLKANSYATIQDIGSLTEYTTLNKLNFLEVDNNGMPAINAASKNSNGIENGKLETGVYYTFAFDGNDYLVDINYEKLYKKSQGATPDYFGVNFLSYNYITENIGDAISYVSSARYFNGYYNKSDVNHAISIEDSSLYLDSQERPVPKENLNTFIITNELEAAEISVGDYVNNLSFHNNLGEAEAYNLIPGITRIISKVFVNVDSRLEFYYKGKKYKISTDGIQNGQLIETKTGKRGFYLFTALDPVIPFHITLNSYLLKVCIFLLNTDLDLMNMEKSILKQVLKKSIQC